MAITNKLPSGKTGGYLALVVTSLAWGTTWVASKIGITQMPALEMAYIRQFLGGSIFVTFYLLTKKAALPTRQQFKWLLVMGILMFVMANGLSTWSLKYIPTGLSSLIGALYPLSVVVIEMIFFRSRNMTVLTFLGLLLGITGIGIVFYETAFQQQQEGFGFGVLLSVIAMLSWSAGTIFITRNRMKIDPYYATGWQMLLGSVILFIIAETSQPSIPYSHITWKAWGAISYLVIVGSVLSFVAFIYSMKKLPMPIASLFAYINPLVAMVTAAILVGETLTVYIVWGSLVTVAGVFLVNYSLRRNQKKVIAEPEQ